MYTTITKKHIEFTVPDVYGYERAHAARSDTVVTTVSVNVYDVTLDIRDARIRHETPELGAVRAPQSQDKPHAGEG